MLRTFSSRAFTRWRLLSRLRLKKTASFVSVRTRTGRSACFSSFPLVRLKVTSLVVVVVFSSPPLPSSSPPSLSLLPRLFPRFPSLSRSFLRPFRARVLYASRRPPAPQTSGTFSSLPTRRRGIRSGRNSRGGSRTTLVLFAVVLSLCQKNPPKKFSSSSLKGRALTLRSFGTTTTPPPRFLKCGNSTSHPQEKKREFFPSLFLSCDMMFRVLNKTLNKTHQRKKRREKEEDF